MAAMAAAYPDLAAALANALDFRLEDLDANRSGRLARRQRLTLFLLYGALAGLTLGFPAGYLVWLLGQPGVPRTELWTVFLCVMLPLFALGALVLWNVRPVLSDLLAGAVAQQVGQAQKAVITRTLRGRADTRYTVQFSADGPETQTFDIPRAAFDALQPGRVYRAYYLPASGKLISIEPIG
jgi:hypothetical protein